MFWSPKFDPSKDLNDLSGKVVIVTGANTGIGYSTVKHLARKGAKVYLGARSSEKGNAAVAKLKEEGIGSGEVIWLEVDLSSPAVSKKSAEGFLKLGERLDILVNNAGCTYDKTDEPAQDDITVMMMTNHVGTFQFTTMLLPCLEKAAAEPGSDVRIVILTSDGHTRGCAANPDISFNDLTEFKNQYKEERIPYFSRYFISKLANVLFTKSLQRRLENTSIMCIAINPGLVNTSLADRFAFPWLARFLLSFIADTPDKGAYTSCFAAASPKVRVEPELYKGAYLEPETPGRASISVADIIAPNDCSRVQIFHLDSPFFFSAPLFLSTMLVTRVWAPACSQRPFFVSHWLKPSSCARRTAATAAALKPAPEPVHDDIPAPFMHPLSDKDVQRLTFQRNIGVSAHIDSGKTTLTERILYYTGRIREIHEVRGRDSVGAKMDSMDLEREKGITIQSAATFCDWEATDLGKGRKQKYAVNIIDTPGHVDFTIEVERALRVLDGAILVLCAVAGVQSQTTTVDRQMRRYNVPRISFVNKMDRPGANPWRIVNQIRSKLRMTAAAVQVPIGVEDEFKGVVDLVHWKAIYNEGVKGNEVVVSDEIPESVKELAQAKRIELIEQLAEADEEIGEKVLMDEMPTNNEIADAIRRATISLKFSPVFMGSAIKNTGVQPLLDGVCNYLPTPAEKEVFAHDTTLPASAPQVPLSPAADAPFVGLAFKLEESRFGQLTYMRVYQGTLKKAMQIFNARTGKKVKVPRLVRMHSNEMEDVESIGPGEICAMFGVECSSGDTFTDGSTSFSMTSMFVPDPVISLSIKPKGLETPNFSRALNRFQKEDPTFKVHVDHVSKETIISGMGELHLEIYVERMRREYNTDCITGKPQVAFRETITQRAEFTYTHKKQTGGAGQYAKVIGHIEPMEMDPETGKDVGFESVVMGGNIPTNFIPAVEKGFYEALEKGSLSGNPITGCRLVLKDGAFHAVDSSELAFRLATIGAFREVYRNAKPVILEPIMNVEVVAPGEFQSQVIGGLNTRRGTIIDSEVRDDEFTAVADVALNDMFGYSNQLRGSTQGKGEFSMEYKYHQPVLPNVQKELEEEYRKTLPAAKK
ncbi:unnamed protein product [Cyclocybe aegerita]|uniref:Elongation factor G, mitochondrial n=1 Tax=Cyclocybe aegerita TaxID=1973307 RepID=A0A8S0WKG2_CYCAE|nr:unnamed protein product [Cyclocybe aegerita]